MNVKGLLSVPEASCPNVTGEQIETRNSSLGLLVVTQKVSTT